mmetsp:Transcript_145802/g.257156  ORF Transcript_145802/g.257156 Transcript_145802/m.257156 type:complete len:507 (-) Transcript_145802:69-1589(-)
MPRTDVLLRCCNGHEAVKYKKLKPWQDRLPGQPSRTCGLCRAVILREDYRWRCEHHCDYDICEYCYDVHWTGVIERASRTEKLKDRRRLLDQVPMHLRKIPEFQEAADWEPPAKSRSNGHSSSAWEVPARVDVHQSWIASRHIRAAFWVIIWTGAMLFVGMTNEAILLNRDFRFPNVWLLVSLSQALAFFFSKLIVYASSQATYLGTIPDCKLPMVAGLMRGFQISLGMNCIRFASVEMYRAMHALLYPSLVFAFAVLRKTESIHNRGLVLSVVCAAIGGFLAVGPATSWDSVRKMMTEEELTELSDVAVSLGAAGLLAGMRLVLVRDLLVQEDRHRQRLSPLVFATRMAPWAAVPGFELSALLDNGSYEKLVLLPQPGKWMSLIVALAAGQSVLLIAELHLLEHTSALFIGGLLMPCQGALAALLALQMGGLSVPPCVWPGVALLAMAAGLFACSRHYQEENGDEYDGYRQLPNGQSTRRSHRDRPNHYLNLMGESDEEQQSDWL